MQIRVLKASEPLSWCLAFLLASMLYEITPHDTLTYAAVSLLLMFAALIGPRRAVRQGSIPRWLCGMNSIPAGH